MRFRGQDAYDGASTESLIYSRVNLYVSRNDNKMISNEELFIRISTTATLVFIACALIAVGSII